MKGLMILCLAVLLTACGTTYSLRDTAYNEGLKVNYDASKSPLIEQKIQLLVDKGQYEMVSRETFSGRTTFYLEHGSELNLTSGQRGVKTGRLYRVVLSEEESGGVMYVLGQEKFGFNGSETETAAQALAHQLSLE